MICWSFSETPANTCDHWIWLQEAEAELSTDFQAPCTHTLHTLTHLRRQLPSTIYAHKYVSKLHFHVMACLKLARKTTNINVDMLSRSKEKTAAVSAGFEHVDYGTFWWLLLSAYLMQDVSVRFHGFVQNLPRHLALKILWATCVRVCRSHQSCSCEL